jgi:hypothetical protein
MQKASEHTPKWTLIQDDAFTPTPTVTPFTRRRLSTGAHTEVQRHRAVEHKELVETRATR